MITYSEFLCFNNCKFWQFCIYINFTVTARRNICNYSNSYKWTDYTKI